MTDPQPPVPRPHLQGAAIPNGDYTADPAESELLFRAKSFALFWVRGSMPAASGTIRITDGNLSGTGTIAADQVTTGVGLRDWHLRSSHYLHSKRYPGLTLAVNDADIDSGRADCTVTVRDTASTVPMTLKSLDVVDGGLRLEAGVELDRTVYPMLPPLAGVSRKVHVDLIVVARSA